MLDALVHGLEQALQALGKGGVTLRAAEASGLFEIGLGKAAAGASDFHAAGGLRDLLRGAQAKEQVGRGKARVVDALLFGTILAQVHLLHFVVHNLRQVNLRRVLFA